MDRKQAGLLTGAALSTIGVWSAVLVTAWSGGSAEDQVSDSVDPLNDNDAGYAETVEDEQTDRSILDNAYGSETEDDGKMELNDEDLPDAEQNQENNGNAADDDEQAETSGTPTNEEETPGEAERDSGSGESTEVREVREGDSIGYGDGVSVEEVLERLNDSEQ
ncbi:hypothetical protein [Alkalicoccus chagannorensis]|uniref:hypothetical protein n=1 Tax=Alkalicoccus chagannorensis TaxID=427072 RepID=UPI00041D6036|nr:hypothetical protein [Alkalicoccus chagannorensis]